MNEHGNDDITVGRVYERKRSVTVTVQQCDKIGVAFTYDGVNTRYLGHEEFLRRFELPPGSDTDNALRAENERLTSKVSDLEADLHDEETRVRHYSERVTELEAAAREALGCFEAAEAEGLSDRLASTTYTVPGSLYDLITRRLAYAPVALRAALSETQP